MIRFLIIALFFSFNLANAKNLHGKITYTVNTARIAAFEDLARKIPKQMYKEHIKDKNIKENLENIKNKKLQIDSEPKRNINPFYVLNRVVLYSVEYEDDFNKKYYYNTLGHLVKYEINDYNGTYPYRAIAYDRSGNVMNITLVVSQTESFMFDKNEKLLGHWVDNEFFDENEKKSFERILE